MGFEVVFHVLGEDDFIGPVRHFGGYLGLGDDFWDGFMVGKCGDLLEVLRRFCGGGYWFSD
jgi:hypothetical protein